MLICLKRGGSQRNRHLSLTEKHSLQMRCDDNWHTQMDLYHLRVAVSHVVQSSDTFKRLSDFYHLHIFVQLHCDGCKVALTLCSWSVQTVVVMNVCIIRAVCVTGLPLPESDSLNGAPIITGLSTRQPHCLYYIHAL